MLSKQLPPPAYRDSYLEDLLTARQLSPAAKQAWYAELQRVIAANRKDIPTDQKCQCRMPYWQEGGLNCHRDATFILDFGTTGGKCYVCSEHFIEFHAEILPLV